MLNISQPLFLLGGVLSFALGAGIAHYLGGPLDLSTYLLGQVCITLLQLTMFYLNAFFGQSLPGREPAEAFFSDDLRERKLGKLPRNTPLLAAAATLTVGAVVTYQIIRIQAFNPALVTLIGLAFILAIAYAVPPLRLVNSGYGELASAILMANLIPAFAFVLLTGSLHRMVALATFPLTWLYLAMTITLAMQSFATDLKYGRRNLLQRLGWERALTLHNILIVIAYSLMSLVLFEGMPLRLAWPGFLSAPVAVYQVVLMRQIAEGAPPRWRLLAVTAIATFAMAAYFLTFSFWVD
jgi:1,4-dihydroxy-2-naphthoate octaprenyltransferase